MDVGSMIKEIIDQKGWVEGEVVHIVEEKYVLTVAKFGLSVEIPKGARIIEARVDLGTESLKVKIDYGRGAMKYLLDQEEFDCFKKAEKEHISTKHFPSVAQELRELVLKFADYVCIYNKNRTSELGYCDQCPLGNYGKYRKDKSPYRLCELNQKYRYGK